ncbi:MAG: pyridoxamine kinase [Treponema sp.]|nr:pyridoxamine kinase [Treponema sp.]
MKRIITIQDISCVGKCSLTVALPVISVMGVECGVLPTAVLSTHTAFKGFTFRDLTSDIAPICEHWKKEKIHFDAIYTGYLGSFEQLDLMHKLIGDFAENDTLTIVDPCMADNGSLYPGFTQEFAFAMAKLCGKADVIVPNLTEASFMLGIPYAASGYDENYIKKMLLDLAALGAKKVVLKGIEFESDQESIKGINNKIGIAAYDAEQKRFSWYFHKKMPVSFHGTGDIFASVLTGALMRGIPFEKAYALSADFIVESIKETISHDDYNWYGVDFESAFPYLIKRLEDY